MNGATFFTVICEDCNGTGQIEDSEHFDGECYSILMERCAQCSGRGRYEVESPFKGEE